MLPQSFSFSWRVTLICVGLAAVMVRLSFWQWDRYKAKVALVDTYKLDSEVQPKAFPAGDDFSGYIDRKVVLRGRYDFDKQVIVTNRKHATGPGHLLLAPFLIDGQNRSVIVSRGFIPFADLAPEAWRKYDYHPEEEIHAIVKEAIRPKRFGPKNPDRGGEFQRTWYYEEIEKMAKQLPYPVITGVFLQRAGAPPEGTYPAESIAIEVPPSTHFGYTIEWALLAVATLNIGLLLQLFPWYRGAGGPAKRKAAGS